MCVGAGCRPKSPTEDAVSRDWGELIYKERGGRSYDGRVSGVGVILTGQPQTAESKLGEMLINSSNVRSDLSGLQMPRGGSYVAHPGWLPC